jgi:hypothetical protein
MSVAAHIRQGSTGAALGARMSAGTWRSGRSLEHALRSRTLIVALVATGIGLRLAQYLANRSLWIDEAWLALNLIERPFRELAQPLDFNQGAPIGFLFAEGVIVRIFGYSEYVLRLFPLLSGLLSVPAFAWVARRAFSRASAPLAVLLFAVADGLIYYSSELKPYEVDVAVAVGLLAAGILLAEDQPRGSRRPLLATVAGVLLIPFSFPAIFIAAAVAGTLSVRLGFHRRHLHRPAAVAILLWCSAVVGVAAFGATRLRQLRASLDAGGGLFLGISGSSSPLHAINVAGTEITTAMGMPQARPFNQVEKLALLCALAGVIALLRRDRSLLAMLVVPFPLLLGSSAVHAYPILARTVLFLMPASVLLIAEGVAGMARALPRGGRTIAVLAALAMVVGPISLAGTRLVHPRMHEEIKPVLEFVRDRWRPGDVLYVHYGAQYALLYYDECDCLRLSRPHTARQLWPLQPVRDQKLQYGQAAVPLVPDVILGRNYGADSNRYIQDLNRVRQRQRVWFLYTHVSSLPEQRFIRGTLLRQMASLGRRIDGIDRPGAHAYLYRIDS